LLLTLLRKQESDKMDKKQRERKNYLLKRKKIYKRLDEMIENFIKNKSYGTEIIRREELYGKY
jgi:hypothetical protein